MVEIKRMILDYGRESFNQILSPFLKKEGIVHELLCTDILQQNEVCQDKKKIAVSLMSLPCYSRKKFQKHSVGKQF